jgi:argininosuccinate lyase
MMPQKRNPDMLELIRGKTGSVYGALMAILTILKGQPSTYNRDLQEDKIHVFKAADTVSACLAMAGAIVSNTKFNTKKISAGLDAGFLDATALAEYLVGKGVPFREAHGIVGALVATCEDADKKLGDLSIEEFKGVCGAIEQDVYESLGAGNVAARYVSEGAGGHRQTKAAVEYWKDRLKVQ